jgi:hypothetical protein
MSWTKILPDLFHKIIWIGEANFKPTSHVNTYDCLYWCTENPDIKMEIQLNQPGTSVWGATLPSEHLDHIFLRQGDRRKVLGHPAKVMCKTVFLPTALLVYKSSWTTH